MTLKDMLINIVPVIVCMVFSPDAIAAAPWTRGLCRSRLGVARRRPCKHSESAARGEDAQNGAYDSDVAGAAAQISGELFAHARFVSAR